MNELLLVAGIDGNGGSSFHKLFNDEGCEFGITVLWRFLAAGLLDDGLLDDGLLDDGLLDDGLLDDFILTMFFVSCSRVLPMETCKRFRMVSASSSSSYGVIHYSDKKNQRFGMIRRPESDVAFLLGS